MNIIFLIFFFFCVFLHDFFLRKNFVQEKAAFYNKFFTHYKKFLVGYEQL
jgi:hypothetical protein